MVHSTALYERNVVLKDLLKRSRFATGSCLIPVDDEVAAALM